MQRIQALLYSRAAKATSAACVICGFAWIYAKHKMQFPKDYHFLFFSQWLPTNRWLWTANESDPQLFAHLESSLRSLTQKTPDESRSERQERAMTKRIQQALQRFILLTSDPAVCDALLSSPAFSSLVRFTAEHGNLFDHAVLRQIAELFANISPRPGAGNVFSRNGFDEVMSAWVLRNDCAHLSLCAAKMRENLESVGFLAGSLYPLSSPAQEHPAQPEVDVVFVNGINGSVFHTWRQRDEVAGLDAKYTKCWPRDWLSHDFPSARILGIDVKVRAWSWDPASADRDSERTLSSRSARLLKNLEAAQVGRDGRAVVWVAHSMGGLIVKELLRQAAAQDSPLCDATRGVLFLSTPHRGCTSLRLLFRFPLRLALSRESLELSHECAPLVELDSWFRACAQDCGWHVLNCAEGLPTNVNSLYSVRLVDLPGEDPKHEILIPTDHIDISKPRDRDDLIYGTVKRFLSDCLTL